VNNQTYGMTGGQFSPTNYGRQNKLGSQIDMMKDYKRRAVPVDRWNTLTVEERQGTFPIGVLVDRDLPTYLDSYRRMCEAAAQTVSEVRT
jgi:2-oxoglutarate/2-oxoacid ferredoxin oxidoreductase subunit beta